MDEQPVPSTSGLKSSNLLQNSNDLSQNDYAIAKALQDELDEQMVQDKRLRFRSDNQGTTDEEDEQEEYEVEAIRARRRNNKTNLLEYYVKWTGYPESQNTWEPIDNLKCPELVAAFDEQEKNKRKRRNASDQHSQHHKSQTHQSQKKPRTKLVNHHQHNDVSNNHKENHDDVDDDLMVLDKPNTAGDSSRASSRASNHGGQPSLTSSKQDKTNSHHYDRSSLDAKGFGRNRPLERIIGSCIDSEDNIFFFVKFKDVSDIDLVDVKELEDKAPRDLCGWYRERLYFNLHNPDQINKQGQHSSPEKHCQRHQKAS